jgi:hypothetical protein
MVAVTVTEILLPFEIDTSSGFKVDGTDECIEIIDDALIEAIELGSFL